jgi:hypothetical protein
MKRLSTETKGIKEEEKKKLELHRAPDYVNFSLKISPCGSIISISLFTKLRLCQVRKCKYVAKTQLRENLFRSFRL